VIPPESRVFDARALERRARNRTRVVTPDSAPPPTRACLALLALLAAAGVALALLPLVPRPAVVGQAATCPALGAELVAFLPVESRPLLRPGRRLRLTGSHGPAVERLLGETEPGVVNPLEARRRCGVALGRPSLRVRVRPGPAPPAGALRAEAAVPAESLWAALR
jgi:hypothetical protein